MTVTAVVMAKRPTAGRVKTRLCPPLTPEQAAAVHAVFLRTTLRRVADVAEKTVWCFDPPDDHDAASAFLEQLAPPSAGSRGPWSARRDSGDPRRADPGPRLPRNVNLLPQGTGDLGDRLIAAADAIGGSVLFLGADSPDLPDGHLESQISNFRSQIALGPCDDGGFWCLSVGAGVGLRPVLAGVEWSSGRELRQVRDNARAAGLAVADAPAWRDVDRPGDLATLCRTCGDPLRRDLRAALGDRLFDRLANDAHA